MKFLIVVFASFIAFASSFPTQEISGRILGGQEVFPNEHKFAVALRIQGGRRSLCGGTIISTTFIITAGSCLQGSQIVEALLGAHNLNAIEVNRQSIIVAAVNFIVHPQYNPANGNFDIGLIRTPMITFNGVNINDVEMPELGNQNQFSGELSLTLGWGNGSDSRLHSFQTLVMSNGLCGTQLPSVNAASICGAAVRGRGPCTNDEGGPMLNFNASSRRHTLIGILTLPNCGNDFPILYTRITALRQWISVNTGIDTMPPTSPPQTTTPPGQTTLPPVTTTIPPVTTTLPPTLPPVQ